MLSNFAHNFKLCCYKEVAARGAELQPEFHNDLALLYLAEVTRAMAAAGPEWREGDSSSMPPTRRRLLALLRAPAGTSRYNPERLLTRFPPDAFLQERAVLLSRVERHEVGAVQVGACRTLC